MEEMDSKKKRYKTKKELEEELSQKNALVEEYLDHLKRLKAEFENYKKRVERERAEVVKFATNELIGELLPVLDNLDRALNHSKKIDISTMEQGVTLIRKELFEILKRRGLTKLDVIGTRFDPRWHEAIMQKEAPEYEEGIVIEEVEPGYKLEDRLLRPARVIISKGR